ncbi:MAG TPA: LamG-like jellyroll fold domain-containing protein [Candidatus Thermoplasmatota archaeon]|nr:LamG-like jellyroll fold domain-containing protein [Candidatus Thermoplasmatota archaeon]
MKGLKKILITLHRLKKDDGVSEILGTVLLLAISVALFSALYLMMQTVLVADYSPTADLVGFIDENTVFIEHHGGSSLPSSVSISVSIGGSKKNIDFDGSFDENNNGYWDIGERVFFTDSEISEDYSIDVSVVDNDRKNAIYLGTLKDGNSAESDSIVPEDVSPIIAWWHFDEQTGSTAFDATSNNNHGSITLASWEKDGNNLSGLNFNGENSSVSVERDNHPELDPNEHITMMAWVKNTDVDNNYMSNIVCRSGGSDDYSYSLYLNDGVTYDNIGVEIRTETGGVQSREWDWSEINGSWFHVAASFSNENNGTIVLYHNGDQVAIWNDIGTNIVYRTEYDADQVYIGSGPLYTSNYFKGLLDEIILFNDTLTGEEIYQYYLQTAPTTLLDQQAVWHLNENSGSVAFDSSKNNNHGVINGAEWTVGINESALFFDGSDYIKVNESNSLNIDGDQLTLEAWVKWDEIPSNADEWANIIFKETDTSWGPHYQVQHDQHNEHFEFTISTIESDNAYLWSTTEIQKDVWYYVVGTYDGSQMRIYVNGTLENNKTVGGNFITSTNPVYLGSRSGTERFFNGTIDEVNIYNYVLTQSEIFDRYNQTLENQLSESSLISYWNFDENSGTTAFDSIGSKNGKIYGASWTDGVNGSGLVFDGNDDYVRISNYPNLQTDFTIEAWIKTNDNEEEGQRIFADDENNTNGYALSLGDPGMGAVRFYSRGMDTISLDSSLGTIENDKWYHVVGVADISNNSRYIYVNGNLAASDISDTGIWGIDTGQSSIGGETNLGETRNRFNGIIDEVRIFDKALTHKEIQHNYNKTKTELAILPILQWRLNENSGTKAIDSSNNENNGTIIDASWISGVDQSGLHFNGDEYIVKNPINEFPTDNISVEFWMKSSDTSKLGTPFSYASEGAFNDFLIYDYNSFKIYRGNNWYVDTGISANDGQWHHIVVTWQSSNGSVNLYKNGIKKYTGTLSTGTSITPNGSLILSQEQDTIGGGFDPSQAFVGVLDEIVVYDKILNESQILQRYSDIKSEMENGIKSAQWNLNEGSDIYAFDSIGNNNGIIHNATWKIGINDSALLFEDDAYIVIEDNVSLEFSDFGTIELWINISNYQPYAGLIHKGDKKDFSDESYSLQFWGSGGILRFILTGENGDMLYVETDYELEKDCWHHVVAAWDESTLSLYINGTLESFTDNTIGSVRNNNGTLQIGAQITEKYNDLYGLFGFDGLIDEVIFYKETLTSEDITTAYNQLVDNL